MSDLGIAARIDQIRSMLAAVTPPPVALPARTTGAAFATQLADATGSYGSWASTAGSALATSSDVGTPGGPSGTSGGVDGDDVVADARGYLGVPYRWGGTDPATGLDCSGLVQRVFGDLGYELPRTVSDQKDVGVPVPSMAEAKPGDLLVFGNHHIGIYVGDGKMLHAPHSGQQVTVADVYATPSRIRRVVGAGSGDAMSASAAYVGPTVSGSTAYDGLFSDATERYGLPAGLLRAVARTESGFDPTARSHSGAVGLMQLMPGTARGLGVDPTDPAQAVDGAARLLREHLDSFGSLPLALAAYNAGPGAVRRYDGIPPYRETQGYVDKVLSAMGQVAA